MGKILTKIFVCAMVCMMAAVTSGCSTSGCTELQSATPRADFYSALTHKQVSIDSLSIVGIGAPGDSAIVTPDRSVSSVYLPMRPGADTTSWRIAYARKAYAAADIADTITIAYKRQPWFAGEECGAMYRYHINSVAYTRNLIDSVSIPDSLVTNIDRSTLNIYFLIDNQ